jgi:hypothetical protein
MEELSCWTGRTSEVRPQKAMTPTRGSRGIDRIPVKIARSRRRKAEEEKDDAFLRNMPFE